MDVAALLRHYIEYLTSPTVLLTILLLVGPILYTVRVERKLASKSTTLSGIPGCLRLGLTKRSNLSDQHEPSTPDGRPRVKALFTYPIKSCRGVELSVSEVESTGLKYDRLLTFAQLVSKPRRDSNRDESGVTEPSEEWDHQWRFITQREFPKLALLRTELWVPDPRGRATQANGGSDLQVPASKQRPRSRTRGNTLTGQLERGGGAASKGAWEDWSAQGGCLVVRFPFEPDFNPLGLRTEEVSFVLPLAPTSERAEMKKYSVDNLSIWKDNPQALNITNEIDKVTLDKLRYFLGVSNPLAPFGINTEHKRTLTRCLPADRPNEQFKVGFADAFPVNMLGLASVRATDAELPSTAGVEGKLDARRFRANIYITGVKAFAEDEWKKVNVGSRIGRDEKGLFECEAEYHVACRTARCKLPNVDPNTGIKDKNEPYTTLGKTRKVDQGALPHPCLGMHTIPLFERGIIRVGDEIDVLEKGDHVYEKMFK